MRPLPPAGAPGPRRARRLFPPTTLFPRAPRSRSVVRTAHYTRALPGRRDGDIAPYRHYAPSRTPRPRPRAPPSCPRRRAPLVRLGGRARCLAATARGGSPPSRLAPPRPLARHRRASIVGRHRWRPSPRHPRPPCSPPSPRPSPPRTRQRETKTMKMQSRSKKKIVFDTIVSIMIHNNRCVV